METQYLKHQFVTNLKGEKVAVIVPIHEYEKMLEELEELEDIRLYDEAKVSDGGERISISDYMKKRNLKDG